ncbi:MAG: DUF4056 domain-containing protein [Planctomycetes bacterium]|nr:DUF4056 domain-containing protein [Planctomycetota bacterium]
MRRVLSRTSSHLTSKVIRYCIIGSACIAALGLTGCGYGQPRRRLGCYATSTPGTRYISSDKLGRHSYGFNPFEKNGITYARKCGHIDIAHLRIAADNTKYLSEKIYNGMLTDQTEFSFRLVADRSKHVFKLSYPDNWQQTDKETVAREVSLQLGQYLAFSATTWHEMLTWFGYHTVIIIPEFASAFSWEDVYSNLLGTSIAAKAIRDTDHKYNKAMTLAINQELKRLGGRSGRVAKKAAEMVRGKWFTGNFIVSMKKRNLDIGIDDGFITPMIVPEICSDARPQPHPVPSHDVSRYGFSMEYHIVPKEFEKGKILSIVHHDRSSKTITPDIHYAPIMAHIADVAIEKYGPYAIIPYNPDKVIAQELANLAPSSSVARYNSRPAVTPKKAEKNTPSPASAAQVNNQPLQAPPIKVAKFNKPRVTVTVTQKTNKYTPLKTTAVRDIKESSAFRAMITQKTNTYDSFQKVGDSIAEEVDIAEKKLTPALSSQVLYQD